MRILKYFTIGMCSALAVLFLLTAIYAIPKWSILPSGSEFRQLSETVETPLETLPDHVYLAILAAESPSYLTNETTVIVCLLRDYSRSDISSYCRFSISRLAFRDNIYQAHSTRSHMERQIFELLLTIKINHALTRKQILELTLNNVYFGRNAIGIAQAAQTFFGKQASDLTLPESALLAGLIKSPTRYNPLSSPERALGRRNHILDMMAIFDMITESESREAMAEPLGLSQ